MNNIFLLVINYFRMFFTRMFKSNSKGKALLLILALCCLVLPVTITMMSYVTVTSALKVGMPEIALLSFGMTAFMFIFMLIVTESSPSKKNNDEEMVMSLPIKRSHIIIAKLLYYLIFDFVVMLVLLYPSYIVYYAVVDGTSIWFLIRAFYFVLIVTFIASAISSLLGLFITRISRKYRYSNIIQSTISVFLMIAFIIVYILFAIMSEDVAAASKIYDVLPLQMIADFILYFDVKSFIILTVVTVVLFTVAVVVKSYFLGKNQSTYHSTNTNVTYKETSIKKSLFVRELNKYFSIPIYVTNTSFGPLFLIMMALIICFIGKDYCMTMIVSVISAGYEGGAPIDIIEGIDNYFNIGIIVMIALLLTVSPTTSSAISLEGKELWILKAHPISYKDVFASKLLVNITICGIPVIIAAVLISSAIGFIYLPFLLLIPLVAMLFSSIIGLYSNLLYPKFEYESEQEVVKQGIAVLVSMGLNLVTVVIPIVVVFLLNISNQFLILTLVFVIYLILTLLWYFILNTHGKKLYRAL